MKKQVSIIGCGWLGLPLAKTMISKNFVVKGSTTSKEKLELLKSTGIQPYIVNLNENEIVGNYSGFLDESEIIVINIPPGLRKNPEKNHVKEIRNLVEAIEKSTISKVLYISSTSVFKDDFSFPLITNQTKPNSNANGAKQLIEIEQMLITNTNFKTTILRFGGLFNECRHPAKYLSGKTEISNPEAPINLIHKKDCIEIISRLIKNDIWNVTLNASYPTHPTKKEYYTQYCKKHNLKLPQFKISENSRGKTIDSSKLVQLLNYTFKQVP